MKTLYIVRHAKSAWDDPSLSDHDRPLMNKGVRKTGKISDFLIDQDVKVDQMISSSAVRAYETARLIADALEYPLDNIKKESDLYHADVDQILSVVFGVNDDVNSLMIFGHNPTFTSFANQFLEHKVDWMPTSAIVSVSFETDKWEEIVMAKRRTNFVIFPKML
ncbi:MAG: hypothetical protein CL663_00475 [Bacteroidetes bacterium]|nr:hypothetical protein [Bacteroidota bacterium]